MAVMGSRNEQNHLGLAWSLDSRLAVKKWFPAGALSLILLLAVFLRFYHLANSGSNLYYAATVKSMLASWHNFFYVAYEPAGSVSVDKPPFGFWLQAISAYFLGVNSFALALPQALAGVLSVGVLYGLVKGQFGIPAGLLAALVLATVPATIATERNNTIDGTLVFVLLLAVWAVMRAVESGRVRYLWLMAFLVGLGFNIKMLQAFLPLPAFYAYYFGAGQLKWWQKMVQLGLATILLLIVSFSWAIAVDLTPADQRPYVGSSTNNTVMQLIVGHNGANRLFNLRPGGNNRAPAGTIPFPDNGPPPSGPFPGPGNGPAGGNPVNSEVGQPGPWRLFTEPLVTEASWLLPLAIVGLLLAAGVVIYQLPSPDPRWPVLLLWGGWLVTQILFFSIASLFHAYYMIMFGPPIAALVAIGATVLWKLFGSRPGLAWVLALFITVVGLGFQIKTLVNYQQQGNWLVPVTVILAVGGLVLLWGWLWGGSRPGLVKVAGFGLLLVALLSPSVSWAALTTFNQSPNVALPRSGPTNQLDNPFAGTANQLGNDSGLIVLSAQQQAVLSYLQPRTRDNLYLMATISSMDASPYLLASERAVLTFGGFSGGDSVINADQLAQLVAEGKLAYVLDTGLQQRKPDLYNWVQNHCTLVTVPGLDLQNLPPQPNQGGVPAGGPPTFNLYHCLTP